MTETTESLPEALEDRDITLAFTPAFTPGQIVLVVIGAYLLIRILRGLRG